MTGSLGRHVRHDVRSRDYPAPADPTLTSVRWTRRSPIFDQGTVGSCCGNAAAGWLATDNASRRGQQSLQEHDAVAIYSKATHVDRIGGVYPPTDSGSSGLAVAKAMVLLGLAGGPYRHAFGLDHALGALQLGPVLVGIAWRTGCDKPDAAGRVRYVGRSRGGHEVLVDALDLDLGLIWFQNSWGRGYGEGGRAAMSLPDFGKALADQGDVTVPS